MRTVIIAALAALSACALHAAARTNVTASTTYVETRVRDATNALPAWTKSPEKPAYTAQEVGATDADTVTNIVRSVSRGGLWDPALGVWWTPQIVNGAYQWVATTNVDLSAEEP